MKSHCQGKKIIKKWFRNQTTRLGSIVGACKSCRYLCSNLTGTARDSTVRHVSIPLRTIQCTGDGRPMRSRLRFRPRLAEPNPKSGQRRRLGFETDFTSRERDRDESEMKFWRRWRGRKRNHKRRLFLSLIKRRLLDLSIFFIFF